MTNELVLDERSLIITSYTALLHLQDLEIKNNLNTLIGKFPKSFTQLITLEDLPLYGHLEKDKQEILNVDLKNKLALSLFVIMESTTLPNVMMGVIAEYLLEYDPTKLTALLDQGKKLQLSLDKPQSFFSKITHMIDSVSENIKGKQKPPTL